MKAKINQLLGLPFFNEFEHKSYSLKFEYFKEMFLNDKIDKGPFINLFKDKLNHQNLLDQPYVLHLMHSTKESISVLTDSNISEIYFAITHQQNIYHFDILDKFAKLFLNSNKVTSELKIQYQNQEITTPFFWKKYYPAELPESFYWDSFGGAGIQSDYYGLAQLRGLEEVIEAFNQVNYGLFYTFRLYEAISSENDSMPKEVAQVYTDYLVEDIIVCLDSL